jgi:predicted porin
LLAIDVAASAATLRPAVASLESKQEPPTADELAALQPPADELRDRITALERTAKIEQPADIPPELKDGRDLLYRVAVLRVRRALADVEPVVADMEQHKDKLTPEEIQRLRGIVEEFSRLLRLARSAYRAVQAETTEDPSPVAQSARELLRRAEAMIPEEATVAEEPVDSPATQPLRRAFRFYGSLRGRMLADDDGVNVDGQTSRAGVRVEYPLFGNITALGRGEVGFNLRETTAALLKGGDPGRTDVTDESLLQPRLASIGLSAPRGRITYGKQWSAYYDVAVFSDQMPFLAGSGTGVYSAGTDGGVAGTGRADDALQYRDAVAEFKYTVQLQFRGNSENDAGLVDGYGVSVVWERNRKFSLGGAINAVLDGVSDPEIGEPIEDDRAIIFGSRYKTDLFYAAGTLSLFRNHEIDNNGEVFSGHGLELYGSYNWSKRIVIRAALSYLKPERAYAGDYDILAFTPGANYDLTDRIRLLLLLRIDASTNADGSPRDGDIATFSAFYNF